MSVGVSMNYHVGLFSHFPNHYLLVIPPYVSRDLTCNEGNEDSVE